MQRVQERVQEFKSSRVQEFKSSRESSRVQEREGRARWGVGVGGWEAPLRGGRGERERELDRERERATYSETRQQ
jgi:hypothetical protein